MPLPRLGHSSLPQTYLRKTPVRGLPQVDYSVAFVRRVAAALRAAVERLAAAALRVALALNAAFEALEIAMKSPFNRDYTTPISFEHGS